MKAKIKEFLGENGQTIEKFKKGTFVNNEDILKIIKANIDNIKFEVKERRMGVNEEILTMKMIISKDNS